MPFKNILQNASFTGIKNKWELLIKVLILSKNFVKKKKNYGSN